MPGWIPIAIAGGKALAAGAGAAAGSAAVGHLTGSAQGGVSTPGIMRDETADTPISMEGVSDPRGNPSTGASPAGPAGPAPTAADPWYSGVRDYAIDQVQTIGRGATNSLVSGATRKYIDPLFRDSPGAAQRKYLQEAYPGTNPWEQLGTGQGGSASSIEYSKLDTQRYIAELDYAAKSQAISVASRQAAVAERRQPGQSARDLAAARKDIEETSRIRMLKDQIANDIVVSRGNLNVQRRQLKLAVQRLYDYDLPNLALLRVASKRDNVKTYLDWAATLNHQQLERARVLIETVAKLNDSYGHLKGVAQVFSGLLRSMGARSSDADSPEEIMRTIKHMLEALDRVRVGGVPTSETLPAVDVETGQEIGTRSKTIHLPRP